VDEVIEERNSSGHVIYKLFMRAEHLAYANFNMFRRGVRDTEISSFVDRVRSCIPAAISNRVVMAPRDV
jgi:hypothetical protein